MNAVVRQNPFSTCFTRPGEIPYLLSDSNEHKEFKVNWLADRFVEQRCCGQIVGPHGCGKTTLCHAIADQLRHIFPTVDYVAIRSARDLETKRFCNSPGSDSSMPAGPRLTIVDGAERVSLLQQRMIVANLSSRHFESDVCRTGLSQKSPEFGLKAEPQTSRSSFEIPSGKKGFVPASPNNGLIFTSHRPLKFVRILFTITPSLSTFTTVARYLDPTITLSEEQLSDFFERADHNIREAIMLLYDWHESLKHLA